MPLTKPNQALRRELQGTASDLKWSAVDLMRIAERLSLAGNETDAWALSSKIGAKTRPLNRLREFKIVAGCFIN
ncbi:hypothetical protein [Pseudomonas typographi]|uniref:Uncharacterized protein n=1 Tax=Pseudomonas typographi TaxID=2715964 RepID=A0ABR7ZAD1_9PSED|nr:hypothetical protein [Pseudomonas typographi]MBD1602286.1 hypothetical protein [Pseudomonas typographi]